MSTRTMIALGVLALAGATGCATSSPDERARPAAAGEGQACGGRFDVACAEGLRCDVGTPGQALDQGGVCRRQLASDGGL